MIRTTQKVSSADKIISFFICLSVNLPVHIPVIIFFADFFSLSSKTNGILLKRVLCISNSHVRFPPRNTLVWVFVQVECGIFTGIRVASFPPTKFLAPLFARAPHEVLSLLRHRKIIRFLYPIVDPC